MADRGNLPEGFVIVDPNAPRPAAAAGDRGNLPEGFVIQPQQSYTTFAPPTEQPGYLQSIAKALPTVGIRGLTGIPDAISDPLGMVRGLISPQLEDIEQSARLGHLAGDAAFQKTGIPEYQAQTPAGRVAMAASTGAVSGAPFGLARTGLQAGGALARAIPSALSALGGATGQTVRETLPGYDRLAAVAELAPSVGVSTYRAVGPRRAAVPGTAELETIAGGQFDRMGSFGVELDRGELTRRMQTAQQNLYREGVDPLDIPSASRVLDTRVDVPGAGPLTMDQIHTVRKALREVVKNNAPGRITEGKPSEVRAALELRGVLDDYVSGIDQNPQHVTAGVENAAAAAEAYRKALGDYASSMRSDTWTGELTDPGKIAGILPVARAQAEVTGNLDRALRQQILAFQRNPKATAGYLPDELAEIDAARRGGVVRNTARGVAGLLGGTPSLQSGVMGGGGGALAHYFGLDPYSTAAIGFGLPAIGVGARKVQGGLGARAIENAAETVRMNSPEYRDRLAALPARDQAVLMSVLPGLLAPQPPPPATADPIAEWMKASGLDARFTPGGSPTPVLDALKRLLSR